MVNIFMEKLIELVIPSILLNWIKMLRYELMKKNNFLKKHGYRLNIDNPRSFNEKIFYRKYYGNFKFMATIADKYMVREYVSAKVGEDVLIPILGVYESITVSDWENLPDSFVLKTNHGSGANHIHIVKNKNQSNRDSIINKMNAALKEDFGVVGHQPFYNMIKRVIIAEKYLDSGAETVTPDDYKFHCFKDKILIQVDRGRYSAHHRSIFSEEWVEMDYKLNSFYPKVEQCPTPANLDKMLSIAKALASDFDYIRVDLYNIDGKIFFGELTQTHGNGREDFEPTEVDFLWGEYWDMEINNPQLYLKR